MKITAPHDHFTNVVLSPEDRACKILAFALKNTGLKESSMGLLRRKDAARVSAELKRYFPDLLFSLTREKGERDLVILFEHKSAADKFLPVQLLSYMANLMKESCLKRKMFLPVIPIVLYHGKEKWKKRTLAGFFKNLPDWIKNCLPRFKYYVVDLGRVSRKSLEREFKQNVYTMIALITLKYIFYPNKLEKVLVEMLNSNKMDTLEEEEFICHLFVYLVNALGDTHRAKILKKALGALNQKIRRKVMTIAEGLMHEGELIGEKRGALRNQQETLVMLLSEKFSLTRYEKSFVRSVKIRKRLERALILVLKADKKEEVLAVLKDKAGGKK